MFDSIDHMTLKLLKNHIFRREKVKIWPLLRTVKMGVMTSRY